MNCDLALQRSCDSGPDSRFSWSIDTGRRSIGRGRRRQTSRPRVLEDDHVGDTDFCLLLFHLVTLVPLEQEDGGEKGQKGQSEGEKLDQSGYPAEIPAIRAAVADTEVSRCCRLRPHGVDCWRVVA